jgi:small conductance mechanosensitive channel
MGIALLAAAVTPQQAAAAACGNADKATPLCLSVFQSTGNAALARASDAFIVRPAKILLIVAVAIVATRLARRLISRAMGGVRRGHLTTPEAADGAVAAAARRAQRAGTVGALLSSTSTVVIWSFALLMALGELGLDLGPLIAGAGIAGVAIGFGAQHLVRDLVSGVFMLVEDQYGVGDVIDVGPASGTVEGVSLRTTSLRDVNGTLWHVPNGQIERVGNKSQQWSRAVLDVEVAYQTDLAQATDVIKRTADDLWHDPAYADVVLAEPEVWGVESLGADSIAIRLVVKTGPNQQLAVARELRARIKAAFDEAGIEIPFPQRTVWHRMDEPGALVPVGRAKGDRDGRAGAPG